MAVRLGPWRSGLGKLKEDIDMKQEEYKAVEDKVEALRKSADQAAEALAADPENPDLQSKADAAEGTLADAEAELEAAVVDDESPEGDPSEDNEDIDFEEELNNLEGNPTPPASSPEKDELTQAQKALFHNAKRLAALGGDPAAVLAGLKPVSPSPVVKEAPAVVTPTPSPEGGLTKDDLVEMEFGKIAKSEAERKVYLHHYKNSIVKTGNITADMENAMLIANKGKILRSFSEISRAGAITPRPPSGNGTPPAREAQTPKANAAEASVLRRRGFKEQPDGTWKGKKYTLSFDPKTKQMVQKPNI